MKSGIHLAEVSVFAGMTAKNRHFRDLSQQVLSGVVAKLGMEKISVKSKVDRKHILTFHRRNDSTSITVS